MAQSEPVSYAENRRAFFETISPDHHARCLLAWLQAKGHGGQYLASVTVRDAYPEFCAERGWEPLPWVGRDGVGKHLAALCGGKRPIKPDPDAGGKPTRCYAIPAALVELAAVERKRA